MKCLAIIPARGGSSRLPGKNIRDFNGTPLIGETIKVAFSVGSLIDRLIVSTDCPEIAEVCISMGCDVPFLRPQNLATSEAKSIDVVLHCLSKLKEIGDKVDYDWVLLLQPTSPLRKPRHIKAALGIAESKPVTAVVSVCNAQNSHPEKLKLLEGDKITSYLDSGLKQVRGQDLLPVVYNTNGAIYLTRSDVLIAENSFFGNNPTPLVMEPETSIDIDTEWDFFVAAQTAKFYRTVDC
jgi:CMP-N-acetylneuraminic acid synthetase